MAKTSKATMKNGATQPKRELSPEARARIAQAAKEMHARRRAAQQGTGKAQELRKVADVLEMALQLSPEARSYLKTLL